MLEYFNALTAAKKPAERYSVMKRVAITSVGIVIKCDVDQLEDVWRLVVEPGTATPSAETDHS